MSCYSSKQLEPSWICFIQTSHHKPSDGRKNLREGLKKETVFQFKTIGAQREVRFLVQLSNGILTNFYTTLLQLQMPRNRSQRLSSFLRRNDAKNHVQTWQSLLLVPAIWLQMWSTSTPQELESLWTSILVVGSALSEDQTPDGNEEKEHCELKLEPWPGCILHVEFYGF